MLLLVLSVLQLWADDPDEPAVLYMLPIVVVALELGIAAGTSAAAVSLGLGVVWTLTKGLQVEPGALLSRAAGFVVVAAVVGFLAQRLSASSRRLRAVLDTMLDPCGIYSAVRDADQRIVDFRCEYVNDAACRLAGLPRERQVGARLSERVPRYVERGLFRHHRHLVETGEPLAVEDDSGPRILDVRAVRLGDGFAASARDITERRRDEERLVLAQVELERSNAALTAFAHVVSHELSQPLAAASLYTQILQERQIDPADGVAQGVAGNLRNCLDRMQERIAGLLAHAELREEPAETGEVHCDDVVREVLAALEPSVTATGAEVWVGPLPTVLGDHGQLCLLFENLLSNAMRYRCSGERPEVSISAEPTATCWQFAVSDHGAGIAPEDAERIFGLFERGGRETRPGTGIGLAVCRKVVEEHGGSIWVESRLGGGSTFHFTLP